MVEQIRVVSPPKGFSRILYRLPILLYRVGLGGMFGSRFLLLKHRGRKSGRIREAVIEIIHRDQERDRTYSPAAWGERADWYQNLQAHPEATICIGKKCKEVKARTLPVGESRIILEGYATRHPTAARSLAKLMGYRVKSSEDFVELAASIPIVVFEPVEKADRAHASS